MPVDESKTLRKVLLAQRSAFAREPGSLSASQSLIAHLTHFLALEAPHIQTIGFYWPIQAEIDLRECLSDWAAIHPARQLALPLMRTDRHLDFYTWRQGDTLVPNPQGILEPDPKAPLTHAIRPDCLLIPCVGWLSARNTNKKATGTLLWRLGYGGGYFDRTLAQLRTEKPQTICIGVAYDWQELEQDQWCPAAHDEPLDLILTETGMRRPQDL